jgi:hypothetical protein
LPDEEPKKPIKRGPKGGKKHTPGRGHTRKSEGPKKKRFQKTAKKKRKARDEAARQAWKLWDSLPDDVKKRRPELEPTMPRPDDA